MTLVAHRRAVRFAVISDLHLGRRGAPLACAVPTADIASGMAVLRGDHDLVVVNGDLFDLDRGVVPFCFASELSLLMNEHAETLEAFRGDDIVHTAGNHDRVRRNNGDAVDAVEVRTPAGSFRVEHGERFNAWIKRNRAFTSAVTWASGRVVELRATLPIYRIMHDLDQTLTGSTVAAEEPVVAAASRWLDASRGYAGMVIGHTHAPLFRRGANGVPLMNPGGCTDQLHTVSIDTTRGTIALLRWESGGWVAWHEAALRQ